MTRAFRSWPTTCTVSSVPGVAAALSHNAVPAALLAGAFDVLNYAISCAMGRAPKLAAYIAAPG